MKISKKTILKGTYYFFKNLILSVLFLSIIIGVVAFYMPMFRDEEIKSTETVVSTFYEEDRDTADVVFVGSSALYRFISPAQIYDKYGIAALNYAAGALDIQTTCGIIDDIVEYQHPEVIVVEMRNYVNNCEEQMGGKEYTERELLQKESFFRKYIYNIPISHNRTKIIGDTVSKSLQKDKGEVLKWQFEYFTTHHNWKELTLRDVYNYTKNRLKGETVLDYQNQKKMKKLYYEDKLTTQPLKTTVNENGEEVVVPYKEPEFKGIDYKGTIAVSKVAKNIVPVDFTNFEKRNDISGEWLETLEKIIKKAKSCGTEVVFMTTPYSISETEMAYENKMGDVLAENGMDFLCGNKRIKEMDIDFLVDYYDDKHTNTKGMVKVTNYVTEYLIEKYDLQKSELTEEQKADWDTASEKWVKEVREPGIAKVNDIVDKRKR